MVQLASAAQVTLYWSINSTLAINVLGYRVSGTPTFNQALAEQIGTIWKSAFTSTIGPLCSASTLLVRVGVRDLRTDHNAQFRDTGAAVAGTGTGDALPAGLACCITLRTAQSGKSFRGRVYLGGFNEAQNSAGGVIATAAATAAISFLNTTGSPMTAAGLTLAVLSLPSERVVDTRTTTHSDGSTTVETLSTTIAKSGNVSNVTALESRNALWEHQRRRDNGRGPAPTSLTSVVTVPVSA